MDRVEFFYLATGHNGPI